MKTGLACLALMAAAALAQADHAVSRQVKGVGATRPLAVQNALAEAVAQVQGVVVSTGLTESGLVAGSLDVHRESGGKSVELEAVSVRGVNTITLTQTQGLVKSYEILDERRTEDGTHEVAALVWVYDYASPLADQKTPLAVVDFIAEQKACPFGDLLLPGEVIARQFAAVLTDQLRAAGRFTLLDRSYGQAFAAEKNIWKSEDGDLFEKSKIGSVQGAEYLMAGRIRRAGIYVKRQVLPATGQVIAEHEGHFVAEVRLFVAATRQIVHTGQYRLRLENNDVRNLVEKWRTERIDYDELKDRLFDVAARHIVEDMIEQFYPVRVAAADADVLVLDQGAGRLTVGDIYTVSGEGEPIIDPQTGELLGHMQTASVKVQVRQTLPRFSYAAVVEGPAAAVQVGHVCRYQRPRFDVETPAASDGRKSENIRTPSGGVRMPFDR